MKQRCYAGGPPQALLTPSVLYSVLVCYRVILLALMANLIAIIEIQSNPPSLKALNPPIPIA